MRRFRENARCSGLSNLWTSYRGGPTFIPPNRLAETVVIETKIKVLRWVLVIALGLWVLAFWGGTVLGLWRLIF